MMTTNMTTTLKRRNKISKKKEKEDEAEEKEEEKELVKVEELQEVEEGKSGSTRCRRFGRCWRGRWRALRQPALSTSEPAHCGLEKTRIEM